MYPRYLRGLVYSAGKFQIKKSHIRSILHGKQAGSFAFFQIDKQSTDFRRRRKTIALPTAMKIVSAQSAEPRDLSEAYRVEKDNSQVGMGFIKPDGLIGFLKINCRKISLQINSLDMLIEDMKARGIWLEKDKMIYPEIKFMPIF